MDLQDCSLSSSRGRCQAALTHSPVCSRTSRWVALFPRWHVDDTAVWWQPGRQRQQEERTHSDQPVITIVSFTLPWSLRPRKPQQHFLFSPSSGTLKPLKHSHAAGGYNPADISDTEDQKVASSTRKPQRRTSWCFFFFFLSRSEGKTASGLRRSSEVGDSGRSNAHRFWWESSKRVGVVCVWNEAVNAGWSRADPGNVDTKRA